MYVVHRTTSLDRRVLACGLHQEDNVWGYRLCCVSFKENYYVFSFVAPSFSVLYVLVHVKGLDDQKGQSPHEQKILSPTENAAPEMPRH